MIWDNSLQAAWFYIELKDEIKNNIVREDWLITFKDIINIVIHISNWIYE